MPKNCSCSIKKLYWHKHYMQLMIGRAKRALGSSCTDSCKEIYTHVLRWLLGWMELSVQARGTLSFSDGGVVPYPILSRPIDRSVEGEARCWKKPDVGVRPISIIGTRHMLISDFFFILKKIWSLTIWPDNSVWIQPRLMTASKLEAPNVRRAWRLLVVRPKPHLKAGSLLKLLPLFLFIYCIIFVLS